MILDGLPYVAKRCYTIGRGRVSITENRDELVKEGITLGRSKFFLENFQSTCVEEEIDISGVPIQLHRPMVVVHEVTPSL